MLPPAGTRGNSLSKHEVFHYTSLKEKAQLRNVQQSNKSTNNIFFVHSSIITSWIQALIHFTNNLD